MAIKIFLGKHVSAFHIFPHFLLQDVGDRMLRAQIAEEREQYQPTPLEKVMAMMKSLFMRGMVIYFVVSVFK